MMAYAMDTDEDFKLPLRPWLEKQINTRRYKGLEWEDIAAKQFRLPWVKKNLPDWEDFYKIFRAWAEHRGRGSVSQLDDSKLKSNFRCALNKSVDFVEMPMKSTMNQQTGNYKVYRFLTPLEVREKKAKQSKILTKEEQSDTSSTFHNNYDSGDFKTIEKRGMGFLEDMEIEVPSGSYRNDLQPFQSNGDLQSDSTYYDITYAHMNVVAPSAEDCSLLAISPAANPQFQNEGPVSPYIQHVPSNVEVVPEVPQENALSSDVTAVLEQLDKCGIDREKLCECDLTIRYNGKTVVSRTLRDMDKGYRIFYGDKDEQIRLLQMRSCTEEELSDFRYTAVRLPPGPTDSMTIPQILQKTDLGVVIQYDPVTLSITAKRLCQSQIFFFDLFDWEVNQEAIKLEREEYVNLYSHKKCLLYFLQYLQSYNRMDTDIHLSVGMKPKLQQAMRQGKGVQITLVPYVVKFFKESLDCPTSALSLCFSNPTSMEQLLRDVKGNGSRPSG